MLLKVEGILIAEGLLREEGKEGALSKVGVL
jgi:hypothetical protein